MTAPRVRWEVRDAGQNPRGESPYEATRWSTREEAAGHLGFLRDCGGTAWIVKVTTRPRRVTWRTWRRGEVSVEWQAGFPWEAIIVSRPTSGGISRCERISLVPGAVRAQALALLDENAPRKAGAR